MRRVLPVVKRIATFIVVLPLMAFMMWLGLAQLCRVFTTGELYSRGYGPSRVGWSRLVSFESDPISFVTALVTAVLLTVLGLFVFGQLFSNIRRWWSAE
ncbi:hypothetical protein BCCGELA001_23680 [Bradyrhizobium sp. CCGE-LA001]|nr:hypothetical protein BCCGELA001_23680 [Bradyrhizobium sp. CCGE-LA001]